MSSTSKHQRKASLSKRTKGQHAGEDKGKKSPYPHHQPKPDWVIAKSKKGKGQNKVAV
jgi:hypothetical protein